MQTLHSGNRATCIIGSSFVARMVNFVLVIAFWWTRSQERFCTKLGRELDEIKEERLIEFHSLLDSSFVQMSFPTIHTVTLQGSNKSVQIRFGTKKFLPKSSIAMEANRTFKKLTNPSQTDTTPVARSTVQIPKKLGENPNPNPIKKTNVLKQENLKSPKIWTFRLFEET